MAVHALAPSVAKPSVAMVFSYVKGTVSNENTYFCFRSRIVQMYG